MPDPFDSPTPLFYAAIFLVSLWVIAGRFTKAIHALPTVGPSAPILSYIGAVRFLRNAQAVLQEGYQKYPIFKVAALDRWMVVVSGPQMNEELRKFSDDDMSFHDCFSEMFQWPHTVGYDIDANPIQISVVRGKLTRQLVSFIPDMVDEFNAAFKDLFVVPDDDWVPLSVLPLFVNILVRTANRTFMGLPYCRDPELLDIYLDFIQGFIKSKSILDLTPKPLEKTVASILPWPRKSNRRMAEFLRPSMEQHQKAIDEPGQPCKIEDVITWFLEEAASIGKGPELVVEAFLALNFGAIHTTSASITHAVYHLAANPEYFQPLRDEIEAVLREEEGCYTKLGLLRMHKLDSFLKESQRINGAGAFSVLRKTLKDCTFSNGTVVPAGYFIVSNAVDTHIDENVYEDARVFKPFRFSNQRSAEGENAKHQFVQTAPDFVPFGHGKHACPGRFFAVTQLKLMLAHIVMNYDFRLETGRVRPPNEWLFTSIMPASDVKVLFRHRKPAKA